MEVENLSDEPFCISRIGIFNNVLGRICFCQVAWTAGVKFELEHRGHYSNSESSFSFNCEIASHNPMLILRPKETFKMPGIIIGAVQGDIDDAVNLMHAHTRKHYMPDDDPSSCLVIGAM